MLGLYPPKANSPKLSEGEKASLKDGKGLPPLQFRQKTLANVEEQLNDDPILGLTLVPVFNYKEPTIKDDINYAGCPYAINQMNYLLSRNDTFHDVASYILPVIRKPI